MASFCVLAVAFTVFSTLKASLLPDDRYFNEEDPCDDFSYDGRRLPFAEVLIGKRMFDSRNCGMVVPIGEVNTEIPIVRFSEVRTLAGIREVKNDVYGKRQTAKMKLLPSVFSSFYSRIKIFVFAVNSKRPFSIFV